MEHRSSDLFLKNRKPVLNCVSPYAREILLSGERPDDSFVDRYFGYMWDFRVKEGDAVYGLTEKMATGPLEELGTGAFSRVPFRRIPRIKISSIRELRRFVGSIQNPDSTIKVMWRGQTCEHPLKRDKSELLKLYGQEDVREPSLLPSGSRSSLQFESYMAAWLGLMEIFVDERFEELGKIYSPTTMAGLVKQKSEWLASYRFKLWAFAAAQHYGLPSTGLDLTSDVDIALFFALHLFDCSDSTGRVRIQRADGSAPAVIYLFGVRQSDLLCDSDLGPGWLQTKRAKAQEAFFFGTAWGDSSNRAAEKIIAIFELHNHPAWTLPDRVATLFPSLADDPFCAFLLSARERFKVSDQVPLNRFYYRE